MQRHPQNFEGYCLIAMPAHTGIFARSLVLVTHHDAEEGTLGLIFNKATSHKLADYLSVESKYIGQTQIYKGGPVEPDILSIMGISMEGANLTLRTHLTPEQAVEFLKEYPDNRQLRAYLGYAGWSVGQLEQEIERGDWQVMPMTPALLKET